MKKYFFRSVIVLIVFLLLTGIALAQVPRVAILVVDIFETDVAPDDSLSGDCVLSVDGQDSFKIQGAGLVSNLFPFSAPHGRFVYRFFQDLLSMEYGASLASSGDTDALQALVGSENVEVWATTSTEIWLIAVNTSPGTLSDIEVRIQDVITQLEQVAINDVVINMSFGLVPCSAMPEISRDDYLDRLQAWGVEVECNTEGVQQVACILSDADAEEGEQETVEDDLITDIIRLRDAGGSTALAFSVLHLSVIRQLVTQALTSVPVIGDEELERIFDDQYDVDTTYDDMRVIRVASAGNDNMTYPYFPAILKDVLSVSATYPPTSCSPGSRTEIYEYLNGDHGIPAMAVDEFIHYVLSPVSNYGEVRQPGTSTITPAEYLVNADPGAEVLGCLAGTSFAAPRVSVRMALYLAGGGEVPCLYKSNIEAGPKSDPPLAHPLWDNLSIEAAAMEYCDSFP